MGEEWQLVIFMPLAAIVGFLVGWISAQVSE